LSNEIDRLKILEGKISGVIEHVHRLTAENDKLRQAVKDLKSERKDGEELAGRSPSLTATSKDTKMKGKK
jgi:regulator of replication initiation timing